MSHLGFLNCFEVRGLSYIRRESIVENLSTKRALSQGRILCPRQRGARSHTTVTSVLLPGINPLPETRSLLRYLWNVKLQSIVFDPALEETMPHVMPALLSGAQLSHLQSQARSGARVVRTVDVIQGLNFATKTDGFKSIWFLSKTKKGRRNNNYITSSQRHTI